MLLVGIIGGMGNGLSQPLPLKLQVEQVGFKPVLGLENLGFPSRNHPKAVENRRFWARKAWKRPAEAAQ